MKTSTLFRIIFSVLLLLAFFTAPFYLSDEAGNTLVTWSPEKITEIHIANLYEDDLVLQKNRDDVWLIKDRNGAEADPSLMGALLNGLTAAPASSKSGSIGTNIATLTVKADKKSQKIVLGSRVTPLESQLVEVDGKTKVVEFDLLAVLGHWQSEKNADINDILHKTLVDVEADSIRSINIKNPFTQYNFQQSGGTTHTKDSNGNSITVSNWRESAGHAANLPQVSQIHQFVKDLSLLTIDRFATRDEVRTALQKMPFLVSFETEGRSYSYRVSGATGSESYLLQMVKPEEGAMYAISGVGFRRFVPNGAYFFESVPILCSNATSAIAVSYERDGHRCVLRRAQKGNWAMVKPELPYQIYTPPATMPDEKSMNMVDNYLTGINEFRTLELIDENQKARFARTILKRPTARVLLMMPDRSKVELVLSEEMEKSGMALLSVNGDLAVVSANADVQLAPDIEYFFNPEEMRGKVLQW